jgi:Txe/YoeB family toxin of toxin-antitoxin system
LAYNVIFSRQAVKDLQKLRQAGLGRQAKEITDILMKNPYQMPPRFEKMLGDLRNCFARRINIQHRYIYQVLPNDDEMRDENGILYEGVVHVFRLWTHYE